MRFRLSAVLPVVAFAAAFLAPDVILRATSQNAPRPASAQAPAPAPLSSGVREAAWSPDGKRLAVTWYDAIWTMGPDGKDSKRLVGKPAGWIVERDAAWAPDGKSIAFAAKSQGEFDIWIASATGGSPRKL